MCKIYWDTYENKKINYYVSYGAPSPPKSMLSEYIVVLGSWRSNLRNQIFKFFFEKFKLKKKLKIHVFLLPPPPTSMLVMYRSPGHPTTNIDDGGRGFQFFICLSQILCTWLSEFWLKNCYLVKSPGLLLIRWDDSNLACALSKSMKTVFYEVTYLTLFWPPFGPWGFSHILSLIVIY